jgi:hypothetical protein
MLDKLLNGAGGVAQLEEYLPSKCKAMSSNSSIAKQTNKKLPQNM